jgi:hypothetical protein
VEAAQYYQTEESEEHEADLDADGAEPTVADVPAVEPAAVAITPAAEAPNPSRSPYSDFAPVSHPVTARIQPIGDTLSPTAASLLFVCRRLTYTRNTVC